MFAHLYYMQTQIGWIDKTCSNVHTPQMIRNSFGVGEAIGRQ